MMPKEEQQTQQDTGSSGGGSSGQDIDLSAFVTRGIPQDGSREVRVVKDR